MIVGPSLLSRIRELTRTIGMSAYWNLSLYGCVPSASAFKVAVELPRWR